MKLIDLLLLLALIALAMAVALWAPAGGLVAFSGGCVGLWFLLGDEADA